jgi:hypothetical protein
MLEPGSTCSTTFGELGIGRQGGGAAGVGAGVGAMGQLVLEDPLGRAVEEPDAGRPGGEGAEFGVWISEWHGRRRGCRGAWVMRADDVKLQAVARRLF